MDAHLVVERPGFRLDVRLQAAPGEVVALLGPNGAGKSTALRVLAGLTAPTGGYVLLDGAAVHARPAEHRPVGLVGRDHLLFPHMSALDNVAFGPRCRGATRAEARRAATAWLVGAGLGEHLRARPAELSRAQAQRVALARSLAVRPRLLLLDEPLAALPEHARTAARAGLRDQLASFTGACVMVTHDPLDAMTLAHRLVVLEHGLLVQEGSPAEVARHPRTDYVARLAGLNLYRGTARGHDVFVAGTGPGDAPGGLTLSVIDARQGPVFVAFAPSAVAVYLDRPDGTPRNLWQGIVQGIERQGDRVRVRLDGPVTSAADVTQAGAADLGLYLGQKLWAAVKATETHSYPAPAEPE